MRYFIYFSFDGTNYHGWQIQPNGISVQEQLETALSTLLREKVPVVGAGRTDAGVHARKMVAHFDINQKIDGNQLVYKLNRLLPRDMAVDRIEEVESIKHARFSALSRTYRYYVTTNRDPFTRMFSWQTNYELDFALMNEAAAILLEYEDFAAFCKSHSDAKTTICNVMSAKWYMISDTSWYFEITANRFLRNMVRAIVGTLIEVGRHRITINEFRRIIESKQRTKAGESMPGNALFLYDIGY